ncbi:MAG: helix-turn-helix domain-containing protein [Lachnospiraceae bacterium]|nr:helix-turn-helix domain-containing protein [Lachnospiraceae bacterium]
MPRVALSREQQKRNKIKILIEWIDGRMHSKGLKQEDVAKELNITQEAFSMRMNPKTYEKNKRADPFKFGDLLILFNILEATPEEKERLTTL